MQHAQGLAPKMHLRVTNLRLSRSDPTTGESFHVVLPDIEVLQGARIGLIGASGSGKTTILEALGLLSWPSHIGAFEIATGASGQALDLAPRLRARAVTELARFRAANIGFVVQDGGLLPFLTVVENAALAARLAGVDTRQARARIQELADAVGLGQLLHRLPAKLSGGQRQRAAVLRALATGAHLLIGDEVTAALDPATSFEVMDLLTRTADELGATVILASHNRALLEHFGFQILEVVTHVEGPDRYATLEGLAPPVVA